MPDMMNEARKSVELLSPAGNHDCVSAAIENGADAIYFGLDHGFNARARAHNFGLDELPDLMRRLHRRAVRGYLTLNTLVFANELPLFKETAKRIVDAGIDAVLVQDLGIAQWLHEQCPELSVHASTQMTMTSAETIAVAERLGINRVVLARELSVDEIRKIASATTMPLEVFVHGALCVAYSGQCLTSESLGGRSANRGQCAQACRLPYDLICDGVERDLGDQRYLLSPQDLAGYAQIPELIDAGVVSFKIEGRLKTPEYVANITSRYRQVIDAALRGQAAGLTQQDIQEMEMSFSRGFTPGWLEGNDHKRLVPATESAKRGTLVGQVTRTTPQGVFVTLESPLKRGDGIAFDGDRLGGQQQGGRIYELFQNGLPCLDPIAGKNIELRFGYGAIDTAFIPPNARVWKNDDPALNRRLRASFEGEDARYRRPVKMMVHAITGRPLKVSIAIDQNGFVAEQSASSEQLLEAAQKRPADESMLRTQLERLGGTPFCLESLECRIEGQPMVPTSLLNQLRRQAVEQLIEQLEAMPTRPFSAEGRAVVESSKQHVARTGDMTLRVLCRTLEQVQAAAAHPIERIYVDFHDIRLYREAIEIARQHDREIFVSSVRIHKPGEHGLLRVLGKLDANGFLVRNLAAFDYFAQQRRRIVSDFSLNVANPLTAMWLLDQGCEEVTASYDLNRDQLLDLVQAMDASRLEVVVHQHMPMFHMEHCVFCGVISPGTNKTNCGRPCDRHVVQLRDRVGASHPLHADVACRNTLYNSQPQSGAEVVPELKTYGVGGIRVEFLEQSASEVAKTLSLYQQLLTGRTSGSEVWSKLNASNRVGVTRGTLEAARDPQAIL